MSVATPGLPEFRAAQMSSRDIFRSVLDAWSRPGRVCDLPTRSDGMPPVLLPVMALADIRSKVSFVGFGDEIARLASRVTGAALVGPADADFVVVAAGSLSPATVASARVGSAERPEDGATVFVAVHDLRSASAGNGIVVTGPGSSAGTWFDADGVDADALAEFDRRNDSYPAGIDLTLIDGRGRLVGVPRSNRIRIERAGAAGRRMD
jgi:alpha-D-ribose 1-methylphosphonate 5-triphosphate synthase subunit PhnH